MAIVDPLIQKKMADVYWYLRKRIDDHETRLLL